MSADQVSQVKQAARRFCDVICDLPSHALLLIEDIDVAFSRPTTERKGFGSVLGSESWESVNIPRRFDMGPTMTGVTLSGLLNAIDGIYAQEGRILITTTNAYEVLDAALTRPGRLDKHFEFHNATQWQAESLFNSFYPSNMLEQYISSPDKGHSSSPLIKDDIRALAKAFVSSIPDGVISMAALQGYLMGYKTTPAAAVRDIPAFVTTFTIKQEYSPNGVR